MAASVNHRAQLSRRAFVATGACALSSYALGRTPYGGRLRLSVPWPIVSLDPAALEDGFSALFAGALFEPLYGADATGTPYPALAEALPSRHEAGSRLRL